MASDITSILTPTVTSLDLEVPTEYANTSAFGSLRNEPDKTEPSCTLPGYQGIIWSRLKGYRIPQDSVIKKAYVWRVAGYRLIDEQHQIWWLCKRCHKARRTKKGGLGECLYKAGDSTSGAIDHLRKYHQEDKDGNSLERPNKRARTDDNPFSNGATTAAISS